MSKMLSELVAALPEGWEVKTRDTTNLLGIPYVETILSHQDFLDTYTFCVYEGTIVFKSYGTMTLREVLKFLPNAVMMHRINKGTITIHLWDGLAGVADEIVSVVSARYHKALFECPDEAY